MAAGTLFYGKLSSEHVWQILQSILPEFNSVEAEETQEQTCASPWASSCPPKTIPRTSEDDVEYTYPPRFVVQAAEALCAGQLKGVVDGACAAETGSSIPTSIPEGYYGYTTVTARGSDDFFETVFASLNSLDLDRPKMESLEKERNIVLSRKGELQNDLNNMLDSIGGRNSDKMGPGGELHALKDTCHSVTAGKYIYEVCIFGKAAQKERDKPNDSGTNLGRWKDMEINEDGTRVMKWDQGVKCWNGPARSATVYLTCGAENKVLSADEPETCTYALQMESYVACDEAFKARHEL